MNLFAFRQFVDVTKLTETMKFRVGVTQLLESAKKKIQKWAIFNVFMVYAESTSILSI